MAKARYHVRYAVAMIKLFDYKDIQNKDFLALTNEYLQILHEETKYASKAEFFSLPPEMHRAWINRRATTLALGEITNRNLEWVEEKIVEVKKLQYRSMNADKLQALLTDNEVKEKVGHL
jgi:hypothetical protein